MSVFIKVYRTARSYFPYTLEQLLQRKKKWEGGGDLIWFEVGWGGR